MNSEEDESNDNSVSGYGNGASFIQRGDEVFVQTGMRNTLDSDSDSSDKQAATNSIVLAPDLIITHHAFQAVSDALKATSCRAAQLPQACIRARA